MYERVCQRMCSRNYLAHTQSPPCRRVHACCLARSVPQEVDWSRPTAFVLGNEQRGVSDTAVQLADATAIIPMAGFVESFNISVAAALIMYEAQQQRVRTLGRSGDLSPQQQEQLLAAFLLRGVVSSVHILVALKWGRRRGGQQADTE